MGMRKGKFTEKVCMDCGKTVLMYSSAKRCPKCREIHEKAYHKDYDKNWRKPITAEDRRRYAENRKRKALELLRLLPFENHPIVSLIAARSNALRLRFSAYRRLSSAVIGLRQFLS